MAEVGDPGARDRRALGQALRQLRGWSGLTQDELGARASSDHTYISRLEHGRIDVGWSTLLRLLRALGADLSQLAEALTQAERQDRASRR